MVAVAIPRLRMPWRWNQSTAGFSASVRKTAIRTQVRTWRAIHDDLEQEEDPDRDPEQRKDRRGPKADNALLHVSGGLRRASDVQAAT